MLARAELGHGESREPDVAEGVEAWCGWVDGGVGGRVDLKDARDVGLGEERKGGVEVIHKVFFRVDGWRAQGDAVVGVILACPLAALLAEESTPEDKSYP